MSQKMMMLQIERSRERMQRSVEQLTATVPMSTASSDVASGFGDAMVEAVVADQFRAAAKQLQHLSDSAPPQATLHPDTRQEPAIDLDRDEYSEVGS